MCTNYEKINDGAETEKILENMHPKPCPPPPNPNILQRGLQVESRIKTERRKAIIRDKLKNSMEQLKSKILDSIIPEEFHLVKKIRQHSFV